MKYAAAPNLLIFCMPRSFLRSKNTGSTLLLEIGSASVGAAVVLRPARGQAVVERQFREYLSITKDGGQQQLFSALKKSTDQVLKRLAQELQKLDSKGAGGPPERIIIIYSSPWYSAEVKRIDQDFGGQHQVTEAYIRSLQEHITEEYRQQVPRSFIEYFGQDEGSVVGSAYLKTFLNGYATDRPAGKEARSFGAVIFLGAIPRTLEDAVESAVDRYFSASLIETVTQPYLAYMTLRRVFHTLDHAVFIQVTGECTELTLITDGVISDIYSFGLGENDAVRAAAEGLGMEVETARSAFSITAEEQALPVEREKLLEIMRPVLDNWRRQYRDSLRHLGIEPKYGPRSVILARGDLADFFHQALRKEGDSEANSDRETGTGGPAVRELSAAELKELAGGVEFRPSVSFDPFLALAAMYDRIIDHT